MEHRRENKLPQPGGLTPERETSDAEVSIRRRQLPTPPTSVHFQPIPRSMTLEELQAFRKRIANTRLGNSIAAMASANRGRMRGALAMASHTYHPLPDPDADSVDGDLVDSVMTHDGQSRAPTGGSDVVINGAQLRGSSAVEPGVNFELQGDRRILSNQKSSTVVHVDTASQLPNPPFVMGGQGIHLGVRSLDFHDVSPIIIIFIRQHKCDISKYNIDNEYIIITTVHYNAHEIRRVKKYSSYSSSANVIDY